MQEQTSQIILCIFLLHHDYLVHHHPVLLHGSHGLHHHSLWEKEEGHLQRPCHWGGRGAGGLHPASRTCQVRKCLIPLLSKGFIKVKWMKNEKVAISRLLGLK